MVGAVDEDGDPVLVLKDDDVTVVIDFGLGGARDTAIRAAEQLSDEALAYASKLRELMTAQQTPQPGGTRNSGKGGAA